MAEFFGSLVDLRQGREVAPAVIERAREHCRGGHVVRNLDELYAWMLQQHPEVPFFDTRIATGTYPTALAAFVAGSDWDEWMRHAVYALHGELYLLRLRATKDYMKPEMYRDHVAGASMHKANGYAHMARSAHSEGLQELRLPSWDCARPLKDISEQAVADMRVCCTLRSEKYGQKSASSESAVKSYQAALRNLADALEVHALIASLEDSVMSTAAWLREKATNLALTDRALLAVCDAGDQLSAEAARRVERDLRLAETVARAMFARSDEDEGYRAREADGSSAARTCALCGERPSTHYGFSCRCHCLCGECSAASGARVQECPECGEYTEFVKQ